MYKYKHLEVYLMDINGERKPTIAKILSASQMNVMHWETLLNRYIAIVFVPRWV